MERIVQHEGKITRLTQRKSTKEEDSALISRTAQAKQTDRKKQHFIAACIQLAEEECWKRIHPTVVQAVRPAFYRPIKWVFYPQEVVMFRPSNRRHGIELSTCLGDTKDSTAQAVHTHIFVSLNQGCC